MRLWSRGAMPDAAVDDLDHRETVCRAHAHGDRLVVGGILHRIVEQVREHLLERGRVGAHEHRRRSFVLDVERIALRRQSVRKRRHGFAHQRAEIGALELIVAALLHARELEHALHERREPCRFRVDGAQGLGEALGRAHPIHLERFGGGAQQRQRRLQLMRDVRHEIGLHARELGRAAMRLNRQRQRHQEQDHRQEGRAVAIGETPPSRSPAAAGSLRSPSLCGSTLADSRD